MTEHSPEIPLREAIEHQDTIPLPVIKVVYVHCSGLLTLRQIRENCGLNSVQLERAAGLRPLVVDWCERGRAVRPSEVVQVLVTLARYLDDMPVSDPSDFWKGGSL